MLKIEDIEAAVPDVTIIGAGLCEELQLTREAEAALGRARLIFTSRYSLSIGAAVRRLNAGAEIRDLEHGEYAIGTFRPEMYERLAARVVDAAAACPAVVVLQPGSAMVVDTVSQLVLDRAMRLGLSVRVVPGISCVEAVLSELGYDAGNGVQIVLAQRLVLLRKKLDPELAALIIQPGYYDTRYWAGIAQSSPSRFDELHDHLARSYAPDTEMALVLAPIFSTTAAHVLWFRLQDFKRLHRQISPFHTLFVPARAQPPIDPDFMRRIDSWEHSLRALKLGERGIPVQIDMRCYSSPEPELPADLRRQSAEIASRWRSRRGRLDESPVERPAPIPR
jgi:precorrin-6B methylase 1